VRDAHEHQRRARNGTRTRVKEAATDQKLARGNPCRFVFINISK